jgi:hypothetical protein
MESFEHVVKVFFEGRGYVVTSNVKFPVQKQTKKAAHPEFQKHGYEVDIVAARAGHLVLASVKSYLGSRGVHPQGFKGLADESKQTHFPSYRLFNEQEIRHQVIERAAAQYGYRTKDVRLALCVGKFALKDGSGRRRSGSTCRRSPRAGAPSRSSTSRRSFKES